MEGIYFLVASVLTFTVGIYCVSSSELAEEAGDAFSIVRNPQGETKRYKLFNTKTSWYEALILCKQSGMELATIRNAEDNQIYTDVVNAASGVSTDYLWIGGTVLKKPSIGWCWADDGQPIYTTFYTNWDTVEPNNKYGTERCLSTVFSDQPWNDLTCYNEIPYVCEYFE